jgi:hypothetical protein
LAIGSNPSSGLLYFVGPGGGIVGICRIREDVIDVNSITILEIILVLIVITETPKNTVMSNCSFCIGKNCTVIISTNPIIRENAVGTEVRPHKIASDTMINLDTAAHIKCIYGTSYIAVLYDAVVGYFVASGDSPCNDTVPDYRVRGFNYVDVAVNITLFHYETL